MPVASLSLDLDNKWSYLKTHGDSGWESFPSYLDQVVPRILEFLEKRGLKITFFVVGQDAALKKNQAVLKTIADAGHDIGNHSFNHEPWLHLYSEQEIDREISRAAEHIESATGIRAVGFRGPGFSLSTATLQVLKRRGYRYDASTCPNALNPLARAYYLMSSKLSQEEKRRRKALFGSFNDALRPVTPYQWRIEESTLLEIPVTTMPVFKLPIHLTYLIYLSSISQGLARLYFRAAINLCQWTATPPSLLLHSLDFLSADDDNDLGFFPGMVMPIEKKLNLISDVLDMIAERHQPVTMSQHADELLGRDDLHVIEPKFRHSSQH